MMKASVRSEPIVCQEFLCMKLPSARVLTRMRSVVPSADGIRSSIASSSSWEVGAKESSFFTPAGVSGLRIASMSLARLPYIFEVRERNCPTGREPNWRFTRSGSRMPR